MTGQREQGKDGWAHAESMRVEPGRRRLWRHTALSLTHAAPRDVHSRTYHRSHVRHLPPPRAAPAPVMYVVPRTRGARAAPW